MQLNSNSQWHLFVIGSIFISVIHVGDSYYVVIFIDAYLKFVLKAMLLTLTRTFYNFYPLREKEKKLLILILKKSRSHNFYFVQLFLKFFKFL